MPDLAPIDASDPTVPVRINDVNFKVPLWQTQFDISDIEKDHACKSPQAGESGKLQRCGQCDTCKAPRAWLVAVKKLLAQHGGPEPDAISDGAAWCFYNAFQRLAEQEAEGLKKKVSETPS